MQWFGGVAVEVWHFIKKDKTLADSQIIWVFSLCREVEQQAGKGFLVYILIPPS